MKFPLKNQEGEDNEEKPGCCDPNGRLRYLPMLLMFSILIMMGLLGWKMIRIGDIT